MTGSGDVGRTLGTVARSWRIPGGAGHRAAVEPQLGSVVKGVFDAVAVEVLVDVVAPVVAAAHGLGLHRPGVLHPAAFVDVVNVEVAVAAAAGPQEAVEVFDLPHQLVLVGGLGLGEGRAHGRVHAIGTQHDHVADLAVLNAVEQLAAGQAVAAHQADAHLQVLLVGFLGQGEHLARGRAVDSDRLFHEDVDALLDGVLEVYPAKGRRRGKDRDVARRRQSMAF